MKPIKSLQDIEQQRNELLAIREQRKALILGRIEGLSRPIGLVSMLIKPIAKYISWTPVFMSVAKTIFALFKNKKR